MSKKTAETAAIFINNKSAIASAGITIYKHIFENKRPGIPQKSRDILYAILLNRVGGGD